VRLHPQELGGEIESRSAGDGGRHLRYAAVWPKDLETKELELYNVALSPPAGREKLPKILQFDQQEKARPGAGPLEVSLSKVDKMVWWGIVAVEPATGRAWYRRLQLAGGK
jgi:hypothetical protein